MALGAWQDMFKLIHLEERPVTTNQTHQLLHSDGVNEIVMKEVGFLFWLSLTLVSDILCSGGNLAFRVLETTFSRLCTVYCLYCVNPIPLLR